MGEPIQLLIGGVNKEGYIGKLASYFGSLFFKPDGLRPQVETKRSILALADQSIVTISSFVSGVIIGRTLPKEEYGVYMLGFTIVFLFMTLQSSLILRPYVVFSPKFKGTLNDQYAGSCLIHQVAFSLLSLIALAFTTVLLSFGFGPTYLVPTFAAIVVAIFFILLREYVRQKCFVSFKIKTVLIFDFIIATIHLGGFYFLAKFKILSVSNAYIIYGAACLLPTIFLLVLKKRSFSFSLHKAKVHFLSNWNFAKWLLASAIISKISWDLYPWSLALFYSSAICGVFFACSVISFLTAPLINALTNVLSPTTAHLLSQHGLIELRQAVAHYTLILFIPMVIVFFAVLFFGGQIVEIIYGSEYAGYGNIVGVLSINPLIVAITLPADCGLWAIEKSEILFKSNVLRCIVSIIVGLPLVYVYGLPGIAAGTVLTVLVGSAYKFICFWLYTEHGQ